MAYSLQYDPVLVVPYLRACRALDRAGRVALSTQLHLSLANITPEALADPSRRLSPGSPYFWFYAPVRLAGGAMLFRFVVSDAAAGFGVLRVVYVDGQDW